LPIDLVPHPRYLPWLMIENLWKFSCSKPLDGIKTNLIYLVLGRSPYKIMSVDPANYSRWPPYTHN
jgi:hypothetical protein